MLGEVRIGPVTITSMEFEILLFGALWLVLISITLLWIILVTNIVPNPIYLSNCDAAGSVGSALQWREVMEIFSK